MDLLQKSQFIKNISLGKGFSYCGIARAMKLDDDAARLEKWLGGNMHGGMSYMEKHFDLRIDPSQLVPGARSVITMLMNYQPDNETAIISKKKPAVSKYAVGKDYHEVIREKLTDILQTLRAAFGDIQGRGFVDSAPVLERSWAVRSGLGWVGKNGNLINKQQGSFFFIATLITDLELHYDNPYTNEYCGTCTKCIDHCPTDAILPDKVIDGSKCISYFTIELKDQLIPDSMKGKFNNWIFGCDVCQDVCPWNRFSLPTTEKAFDPLPELVGFTETDWEELTEEKFKIIFRNSPIKRAKFSGIKRNLHFIKQPAHEQ